MRNVPTPNLIHYIDEYVLEEGIQRFMFPKPQTFVCTLNEPHLVKANVIFLSDKREGAFVFCRKCHEFLDVSCKEPDYENDLGR